jgi:pimeloyl-ACP methyl ester carboxylesterase
VLRLTGRRLLDLKLKMVTDSGDRSGGKAAGGDLSWLSPEMTALLSAEVRSAQPQRLGDAVMAFASVMSALFIDQRPVHRAIAAVNAPVLLLWGDQDALIPQSTIDDLARRRPDWQRQVFESLGHLLPLEAPDAYVNVVGQWLAAEESSP